MPLDRFELAVRLEEAKKVPLSDDLLAGYQPTIHLGRFSTGRQKDFPYIAIPS
jgi:hypothetical protein